MSTDLWRGDTSVGVSGVEAAAVCVCVRGHAPGGGELLQRTLAGELLLPVEAIYDLADAAQAAAASLQPGRKGKVLLKP